MKLCNHLEQRIQLLLEETQLITSNIKRTPYISVFFKQKKVEYTERQKDFYTPKRQRLYCNWLYLVS